MDMTQGQPIPVHPGVALREELETRGWSQTDLTFVLGCNPKAVNQIINGKQGVSPAMSKALGEALGLTINHFADLQTVFDLASSNNPDPGVSIRARMQANYPIREMVKRGWIEDGSAEVLGSHLAKFFQVTSSQNVPYLAHAAKKTSYEERDISGSQLAWLFRVRQLAQSVASIPYSEAKLRQTVEVLRELRVAPEEARKVPRLLAECGIRFVVVEALPGSKIDGVCLWLDQKSPVIGMSMRFDRLDNFWFVLRHEIEHVLCGHGRLHSEEMVDAELNGDQSENDESIPQEERVANLAAADFCVPKQKMDSFLQRKHPFYYEKDLLAFSKVNGIHPALAVGQIQRKLKRYDYLRKHQVKIRQFVIPGAIVDGWGQSASANL